MFRLDVYVEDKNLAKALLALAGIAVQVTPTPVVNAQAQNGKVVAKTDGSVSDLFREWIKETKVESPLKSSDFADFVQSIGRKPSSRTYIMQTLKESGVIRQGGKPGHITYKVTGK